MKNHKLDLHKNKNAPFVVISQPFMKEILLMMVTGLFPPLNGCDI